MRYIFTLFSSFFLIFFFSNNLYASDCEKPKMPSQEEWKNWILDIKKEALELGISEKTLSKELDSISPQKKIIMRDRCQPESRITFDEYVYYRIDKSRIIAGRNMMKKYKSELEEVGNYFNIQPRFIVSVLGLESFYGKNQGKIKSIEAIGTLAFDRRR